MSEQTGLFTAERDPHVIAIEIITIREQAKASVLQASMEIGRRLVEVKALLPHGTWGTWLLDNVQYSERTAQNLMQLFQEYSKSANPQALADLTYTKAVALLALPASEREQFLAENDVEGMSTREIEEQVREINALRAQVADQQLKLDVFGAIEAEKELAAKRASDAQKKQQQAEQKTLAAQAARKTAEQRAETLKQQLEDIAAHPVTVEVERVPAEVERELTALRERARTAPCASVIQFRAAFADWQAKLDAMLQLLPTIEQEDAENAEKYRGAVQTACRRVIAAVEVVG